ncbi:MAG: M48 family metalloprotease [Bacteroidota bacterium]
MGRKFLFSSLLLIFISGMAVVVNQITIKNNVDMRSGPGSYYELILRLNSGAEVTEIEKQQQWVKVEAQDQEGWIPERAANFAEEEQKSRPDQDEITPEAQTAFEELGEDDESDEDPYASPAQVAAAVKGFATDFTSSQTGSENNALLDDFETFHDPQKYREFRSFRLKNWTWQKAQSRLELDPGSVAELDPVQEQIGWGIANVIAQQGLINNNELQEYLTHIALVLVENSHRYETPVRVYILDTDEISGYAAPNGAIFVSKGALEIMESETEFAFFAAHELTHIVLNHGIKETEQRRAKVTADDRFEELDRELGDRDRKYEDTEEELTQLANEMYEYTIKDRLEEYEYEADYWGVAYMYRAGYNPTGGLDLLRRIRNNQGDFKDEIGLAKWEGTSLRDRIIKIDNQITDFNLPQNFGHDYQSVFQEKVRALE